MKPFIYCILFLFTSISCAYAQQDTTDEEIDFSQYAKAEPVANLKRFCTSKVFDLSPNKLISVSYDFQGAHTLKNFGTDTAQARINNMQGIRLACNVPVVSKTSILWSIGAHYWRMQYQFDEVEHSNYLMHNLHTRGLTSLGLNTTLFKPLDEKHFILAFLSADANGDFTLNDTKTGDYLLNPRITVAALYGKKRNDRSMWAVGVTRTYRAGNQTIFPLIMWNHTFPNRKWGLEMLFPSRVHV
jgi:hypothetical protein